MLGEPCCIVSTLRMPTKKFVHKFSLLLVVVFSGTVPRRAPAGVVYGPGFVWSRYSDYSGGTTNGLINGNPNLDSLGNPTWYYQSAFGGSLSSGDPWYLHFVSRLVWNTANSQWRADAEGRDPAAGAYSMAQADAMGDGFRSPVVKWQNPTAESFSAVVCFGNDVVSQRTGPGAYSVEIAVVHVIASTAVYELLWSGSATTPWNGQVQHGPPVALGVNIAAGDSILFTQRIGIDSPLPGHGSDGWFDNACIFHTAPELKFQLLSQGLAISWPSSATTFHLQQNPDLTPTSWRDLAVSPAVTNGRSQVILSLTNVGAFFRLRSP
jgi:hypothetical protein